MSTLFSDEDADAVLETIEIPEPKPQEPPYRSADPSGSDPEIDTKKLVPHPIVSEILLHNGVPTHYLFDPDQPPTRVQIDHQGIIWAGETIVAHISPGGHIRHAMEMPKDLTPEVLHQITRSLISNKTYLHQGFPATVSIRPDGSHVLNEIPIAAVFDSHLSSCMAFVKVKVTKEDVIYTILPLEPRLMSSLFCSPVMRETIPQIEVVNEVSMPYFPPGCSTPRYNPVGYNPENRTYTLGKAQPTAMTDPKGWHWDLVKGFKWDDPEVDYPTYVAQTLAGFSIDLITPVMPDGSRGERPIVPASLIQSTSPEGSSGKSILQFLSAVAAYGPIKEWSIDKTELQATIVTTLKEKKRVLFIDEAKYSMGDELLTVISGQANGRVKGVSQSVSGDLHVLLAAVSPKFSTMMARRVLTCSVSTWPDYLTRQHDFLTRANIPSLRPRMLAFCRHLVDTWIEAGCPKAQPNTQWPEYSQIIGGILEANGYRNTLSEKIAAADMAREDNDHIDSQWPSYFKLLVNGELSLGDETADGKGTTPLEGIHPVKYLLDAAQKADFYPGLDPMKSSSARTFAASMRQWLDRDTDLYGYRFKKIRRNTGTCIEITKIPD